METCYRHPDRETGVSCSNCGRPICPDCMTPTPVGMRCPECSRETTRVRNVARGGGGREPRATYALIAINVIVYLVIAFSTGDVVDPPFSDLARDGALAGPPIADDGEWYRLVTSGFLHADIIHIAFNMIMLFMLGSLLEEDLGPVRFTALYLVAMLGGSAGAVALEPDAFTVGASGGVFGLMGAALVMMRARGIDPMQSGLGTTLLLNLGITFLIPGISIGGHLGGLAAGALGGLVIERFGRNAAAQMAGLAALAGVAVVLGLVAAQQTSAPI